MKFNEILIVRIACELKEKPTIIENQVVILSFGSSQFVSFVDSRNRTHDENVALNGSQNYPAKKQKKIFLTDSKSPLEKNFNGRKIKKVWIKVEKSSKGSTIVGKTVRNTQLVRICLDYKQTWLFAIKGTSQPPKYINLKTKTIL